jgi:hypothetical protein
MPRINIASPKLVLNILAAHCSQIVLNCWLSYAQHGPCGAVTHGTIDSSNARPVMS